MMASYASIAFIVLSFCICHVHPVAIDNNLVGDPDVDCQDTMVTLTFNTQKPFTGRVYVKGLADDNRCSRNFAVNQNSNKFSMMVANGDCNMARQRVQGTLEGIMFSLVIVVSFHGTFVTKVDRAYRCMCFFRNVKKVTNFLDMSMIGTTDLLDTMKTPSCSYSIHTDSPSGPLVRYAKVGDKIFHVWECDDPDMGFLVHSCWVNDGRGNRFDLLDLDGCAIDPIIQADLKYEGSLNKAYVETHGYKFSDTSVLDYQCVIELCKKAQGECTGLAPPSCGRGRKARSAYDTVFVKAKGAIDGDVISSNEMDVTSSINILDTLDDEANGASPNKIIDELNREAFQSENSIQKIFQGGAVIGTQTSIEEQMCFSTTAFGLLVSMTVILFIVSAMTAFALCVKMRNRKS